MHRLKKRTNGRKFMERRAILDKVGGNVGAGFDFLSCLLLRCRLLREQWVSLHDDHAEGKEKGRLENCPFFEKLKDS